MAKWQNTLWSFVSDFSNIIYLNILYWIKRPSFYERVQKIQISAYQIQAQKTRAQKMQEELNAEIVRTNGNIAPDFMINLQKKYYIQEEPIKQFNIKKEVTQTNEIPEDVQKALQIVNNYTKNKEKQTEIQEINTDILEEIKNTQKIPPLFEKNDSTKPLKVQ